MPLHYLTFESSDDGEGNGSWDAMASVRQDQLAQVLKEVQQVLAWAEANSPGPKGPMEEGGVWDADLHQQTEEDSKGGWTTVTLTLTGPWDWGATLVNR